MQPKSLTKEECEHIILLLEEYLYKGGDIRGLSSDVLATALTKLTETH